MRAAERDEAALAQARQDRRTELKASEPKRLVFLDESAALTNMSRAHARSPRGTRAYSTIPCGHRTRLTVLGALGPEGFVAAMSIEAATDGAVFHAFLDRVLLPALRQVKPDAVLVMDNPSAHKAGAVRERLERSEFRYRCLPSYTEAACSLHVWARRTSAWGMWMRFSVAAHLSAEGLAVRYRAARDPVERSRWQMLWLLVGGRPLGEVAAVTGCSPRRLREVIKRYNAVGPDALADRRHRNRGAAPLLDAAGQAALEEALGAPPAEGGHWTGRKVAAWIARRTGRERVAPQRGWAYPKRTGHSPQMPRPRHIQAADAAAQAASQKTSAR